MSQTTVTPHNILIELERIDLLIQLQVAYARRLNTLDESFRGLYIAEEEIDALLDEPAGLPHWAQRPLPLADDAVVEALARVESWMTSEVDATGSQGQPTRLDRLRACYKLSRFEIDALLICLTPEIDLRYQRFYGYLQDDITKRHPSVDLALNLLCSSLPAKLAQRRRFLSDAPLIKHRLIERFTDPTDVNSPLLGQYLRVDLRIADYLFESDEIDQRLQPYARLVAAEQSIDGLLNEDGFRKRLLLLAKQTTVAGDRLTLYFEGVSGIGKRTTAAALAREIGKRLLVIDGEQLSGADHLPFETAVTLAAREAFLQDAVLFWKGFDLLTDDSHRPWRETLFAALEVYPGLNILAGNAMWEPRDAGHKRPFVRIEFARHSFQERKAFWPRFLNGNMPVDADVDLDALAMKFRFTAGQIQAAAVTAAGLARWRDPENSQITMDDLYAASRLQSNRKLGELARKISPHYTWDDIVLPNHRMQQLREIVSQIKHRAKVYEEWGFGRKLAMGKGLNALFAGPSGTGKTMAADIMAGALGLDLYKIDLSSVVSKYIGETEKNLARIFVEAETSNAILFFDEAYALFGKRSEVRDSHDRYANIEISYLLQRMEEYDGVVILATNLHKNMDDAFVRRMHFTVEFPFPDEVSRRRIWEKIWPAETPRKPDIDLPFMARRFEITGGNIRNIALTAAFLAADNGEVVDMSHLIRATQREHQKMGKVVIDGEFGEYAQYVRGEA